jgi:hypothetical protein
MVSYYFVFTPTRVVERAKDCAVAECSNMRLIGSNTFGGMDISAFLLCLCCPV